MMKLSPPTPTPPLAPSTSGRRSRHRRTPDGAGSAVQKSSSSDPARKLRSSVKLEFKSTIDGIRSAPDNAYKIASKFVYTFRRYIEPRRLSALLVKAMNNALQNAATDKRFPERIRSLLAFSDVWLRTRIDTECIERHDGFLSVIRKLNWATDEGVREWASRVMCSLLWALSGRRCGYVDEEFYSELAPDGSSGRLWSHKVSSLAEILSSIEWGKFVSIPFADFNNKAWSNAAEHPSRALLLRAFIDRSNRMSDWVLSSVLAQRTLPARAKAFEAFVLLAQECLQEGNYSSASAILGGLQVSEIDRVKSRLPVAKKYIFLFNMIVEQTSPVQNYAKYRRALAERMEAKKRFIPITAVLLKDLTFIEDGNPDTRNEGTSINAEKMTLLQSTYEIIHRSKVIAYRLSTSKAAEKSHTYAKQVFERLPRLRPDEIKALSASIRPYAAEALSDASEESSSSPATARSTTSNGSAPPSATDLTDDSSSSVRDDLVDLPLDISSLSDRSFLSLNVPLQASLGAPPGSGANSSRSSVPSPDSALAHQASV